MRASQFLSELRRNPEQNTDRLQGVLAVLQVLQQSGTDRVGVSMTELAKLGINPQTTWTETPIGIYFYPADYYVAERGRIPSMTRHPYAHVFRYQGSVLNLSDATVEDYALARDRLVQAYPGLALSDSVNNRPGRAIYLAARQAADHVQKQQPYEPTDDYALRNRRIYQRARSRAAAWNRALRIMGYDVVVDPGTKTIDHREPTQGIILDPRQIEVIDRVSNRHHRRAAQMTGYNRLLKEPDPAEFVKKLDIMLSFAGNNPLKLPDNPQAQAQILNHIFTKFINIVDQHPELMPAYMTRIQAAAPENLAAEIQRRVQRREAEAPANQPEH